MKANKTPLQAKYNRSLADLNDQLCYFLFARELVRERFKDFSPKVDETLLPVLFASSTYAPKINIYVKEVAEFERQHERSTFGAYVSTSYEVVKGFLEASLDLLKETNGTYQLKKGDSPEETYWESLIESSLSAPDIELQQTLS